MLVQTRGLGSSIQRRWSDCSHDPPWRVHWYTVSKQSGGIMRPWRVQRYAMSKQSGGIVRLWRVHRYTMSKQSGGIVRPCQVRQVAVRNVQVLGARGGLHAVHALAVRRLRALVVRHRRRLAALLLLRRSQGPKRVSNRPVSVYRLGQMPIQSCGQSVSAPRGKASARLNAHRELRAMRQRSAKEAIHRNRPIFGFT
jgi:hypothetical protein